MLKELDRVQRIELFLSLALAVAFIGYIIAIYVGDFETEVIRDRYWKDVEPLFNGEIPIMEYPPFAFVFMIIPRLFFADPFGYNVGFVIEMYVFTIIGLILTRRLAEKLEFSQVKAMTVYSVLMVLLLEFITDRYDIVPAVMSLAAFYLLLTKRPMWAFILLALGMMTKLYPAMYFPIFLMMYIVQNDWKGAGNGFLWFALTSAVIFVPLMLIDPDLFMGFLTYHSNRPLEVGSLAATLLYPFSMMGLIETSIYPAWMEGSFGSDNLVGPVPDAVAGILSPVMVLCVLAIIFYYAYIRKHEDREKERIYLLVLAMLGVTLVFMLIGKVFSSQYLIWAIPFFTLVIMMMPDRAFSKKLTYLLIVSFILTQVNCVYIYEYLGGGTNINDLAMISMLIRNLMIVATLVITVKEMVRIHKECIASPTAE
ncbi:MAG: DUF2029 domain-containing protein [Candidatus Methanomethylophilaceae archaeon]|nr:DUF2029 domain-containing protein [Candidatus Methanomethylophilaceae archaeon]